jgi:hypothetical protein
LIDNTTTRTVLKIKAEVDTCRYPTGIKCPAGEAGRRGGPARPDPGGAQSLRDGLSLLDKSGRLVLLAVHEAEEAREAFRLMQHNDREGAYKVTLHP